MSYYSCFSVINNIIVHAVLTTYLVVIFIYSKNIFFRSSPVHIFGNSNSLHSYARPPLAGSAPNLSRGHLRERRRVRVNFHLYQASYRGIMFWNIPYQSCLYAPWHFFWQLNWLHSNMFYLFCKSGQQWIRIWSFLNVLIIFWWWRHGLVTFLALHSLVLLPQRFAHLQTSVHTHTYSQ